MGELDRTVALERAAESAGALDIIRPRDGRRLMFR